MGRTRRDNFDKKNGKSTTAGNRNGHEKHCRDDWCSCGGKGIRRNTHKQDRRQWRKERDWQEPGRKWV